MALSNPTTAARDARREPDYRVSFLMGASAIYKGDIVVVKVGDGLAYPVYETGDTGDSFVGVAVETQATPVASSTRIKVDTEGTFEFTKTTAAITDVGNGAWTAVAAGPTSVLVGTVQTGKGLFLGKVVGLAPADKFSTVARLRVAIAPECSDPTA